MWAITPELLIDDSEFEIQFSRSTGPGGQNVNKVNSKATLRWNILESPSLTARLRSRILQLYGNRVNKEGDLIISSDQHRSRDRNMSECYARVQEILLHANQRPKTRHKTKPTKNSKKRRLDEKRNRSEVKSRRKRIHEDH